MALKHNMATLYNTHFWHIQRSTCKENSACCKENGFLTFSVYVIKFNTSRYHFCLWLNRYSRWLYGTPPNLKCNNKFAFIVCLAGIFVNIIENFHCRFIIELWRTLFFFASQLKKKMKKARKQHILWINTQTYM